MYEEILEKIGLNKGEAKIYETLLREGSLPVISISKKTGLTRTNTYNHLYSLAKKGLVESRTRKKKNYFYPNSPENLRILFEQKKKTEEIAERELNNILPSLVSTFLASSNRPSISYWEGKIGLEKIYDDILKEKKELLIFASIIDRVMPEFNELIDKQIKRQARAGIKVRALVREEIINQEYIKKLRPLGIKIRGLKNYRLTSQIIVYNNKVAITSFKKDLMSTLIENESIAGSLKNIFEIIWEKAKE